MIANVRQIYYKNTYIFLFPVYISYKHRKYKDRNTASDETEITRIRGAAERSLCRGSKGNSIYSG